MFRQHNPSHSTFVLNRGRPVTKSLEISRGLINKGSSTEWDDGIVLFVREELLPHLGEATLEMMWKVQKCSTINRLICEKAAKDLMPARVESKQALAMKGFTWSASAKR
jgi:hypothetical protein